MSFVPAQFKVPAVPQVNLLPSEVGERRAKSRRRGVTIFLLVLFLLAVGAGYFLVAQMTAAAQAEAEKEEARTAELQGQIAALSEVDTVKATLANSDAARQYVASEEFFWPLVLAAVDGALPETASVQNISVTSPPFGEPPAGPGSPLSIPGVADVTMTIAVPTYVDAAEVEDSLNDVPFFTRARASQVTVATSGGGENPAVEDADVGPTYLVDVSFTITYDALMMRYSPRWFGTDDEGEGLETYYQAFLESLLSGNGAIVGYPPLPEVTPPPFIPGQGAADTPAPQPSASPSPDAEGA